MLCILPSKLLKFSLEFCNLMGVNHSIVRWLRLYIFKMASLTISNTSKGYHNFHMLWMCIGRCILSTLQLLPLARLFCWRLPLNSWYLLRVRSHHSEVVEAIDPFKMASISISNTSNVFHSLHMICMFIWKCPCHIITALIGQAFGNKYHLDLWLPPEGQSTS